MKAKNIIIGILVAIGGLTSCTSEDLIEPRVNNEDISIVFSVKDIQTKADPDDHYTYATTDEIKINNCIIAAFNGDITQSGADDLVCVGYGTVDKTSGTLTEVVPEEASEGEVPSYKCKLSNVKLGGTPSSTISFVVIANSQCKVAVGRNSTYSEFKKLVETTTEFNANELVKVGYKVVENLSATNKVVKVPLIQLTARIDFGGVTLDENFNGVAPVETPVFYPVTTEADRTKFSGIVGELFKSYDGKEGTWDPTWEGVDTPAGYYYFYTSNGYGDRTYYRVKFYKQTKVETTGEELVVGESKTIGGVNTKSTLPIFSTSTIENQEYEAKSVTIKDTTFYTYESDKERNVTLTVNCSVGDEITSVKYAYEIQVREWTWNSDDYMWMSVGGGDVGEYEREGDPVVKGKDYVITLPGSKIIKGHLYRVTGICTPSSDVTSALMWTVIDLTTGGEINISFD